MNRKQKIIVSITSLVVITLILLGLTYGYFITQIIGNTNTKSISAKISNLKLTYGEDTSEIQVKTDIRPGDIVVTKTFTATNTGDGEVNYVAVFENITNELTRQEDLVYSVECVSYKQGTTTKSGTCDGVKDIQFPKTGDVSIMVGNRIPVGITHSYTLSILYKEAGVDQSADMGKTFGAKVNIRDVKSINPYTDGTLAHAIVNNAIKGDNGTELVSTPDTKVAEEISWTKGTGKYHEVGYYSVGGKSNDWYHAPENTYYLSASQASSCTSGMIGHYIANSQRTFVDNSHNFVSEYVITGCNGAEPIVRKEIKDYEKELSVSHDDYGTSYYYRGNVDNNYVDFAEMCWRVVRIQGDGSIKIVLEDQDSTCASTDGNWNIPTITGGTTKTGIFGYTHYVANTLTASDGTKNSNERYLMNYLNGGTNNDKSMATAFKSFQTGKLSGVTSKLKAGDWCLDDKAYNDSKGTTLLNETQISDNKVKGIAFYYDSYVRLYGKTIKEPSLKCNGTVMNKFGDNTTPMYVGALTSDEIIYAGGKVYTSNLNYYLINDYQISNALYWWTLTPNSFDHHLDLVFRMDNDRYVSVDYVDNYSSLRPAVTLAASVLISSGDGTKTNSYKVQ